jgi:hypothetical protein
MYETQVNDAIDALYLEIQNNRVAALVPLDGQQDARAFLRWAMHRVVDKLWALLSIGGVRWGMSRLMRSNFLERAAWDLYGPCMSGRLLERRGEWGVVSILRQSLDRRVTTTITG